MAWKGGSTIVTCWYCGKKFRDEDNTPEKNEDGTFNDVCLECHDRGIFKVKKV